MTLAPGFRRRTFSSQRVRSKSKYGATSILLTRTTSQTSNISGYLRGLSSPSGTERIATFTLAPVSNSAGHTRLPTFSRIARSRGAVPAASAAASSSARPWRHITASRWHMPPVWSWIAVTPVAAMARASTSESISASMTPMERSPARASMVRVSVVVLPEPGLLIKLSRKVLRARSSSRRASAARSLLANTLCLTSMTRTSRSRASFSVSSMPLPS